MSLFSSAFGSDSLAIVSNLSSRSDAIKLSGELLQRSGKVNDEYISSMLDAVENLALTLS